MNKFNVLQILQTIRAHVGRVAAVPVALLVIMAVMALGQGVCRGSAVGTSVVADTYDVIVLGGEPEGIAAAVAAARNGKRTLLVEHGEALGGLMTLGGLNFLDMNYGPDKELLTRGIFAEFYEQMGNAFDLEEAKEYFRQLVQKEEKLDLLLQTFLVEPVLFGRTVNGVKLRTEGQENKIYYGARIIDATVDADLAAAAGVPYTEGAEDYGRKDELMGVTLVFRVEGVNWPYVFLYNNVQRLLSKLKSGWGDPYAGAGWKVAWGYGQQALTYQPHDTQVRFRGPNLARQKDGTVLVNALLLFDVNGTDPVSRAKGIVRGKEELPYILEFMREKFPGFARAKLVDTAERLYVRETRHMVGEYRLTITDVLENRDHWDRIAHGSYPVDIQPTAPDNLGNVIGKPTIYSIPFRCLVPLEVENLLVVGRSASFDSLPHGSARVVPVGMATGEAAGVAAAYAVEKGLGFREISRDREAVAAIQKRLREQGAYLTDYTPPRPAVMEHWAYPALAAVRELGLAAGGYGNDYQLETGIGYWDANYVIGQTLERTCLLWGGAEMPESKIVPLTAMVAFAEGVNKGDLLLTAARLLAAYDGEKGVFRDTEGGEHSGDFANPEAARVYLAARGYLGEREAQHFAAQNWAAQPTFGELYAVAAALQKGLPDITGREDQ